MGHSNNQNLPRVFVGSSVGSLEIAEAIHAALDYDAEVRVWNQGIFEPMGNTLETLIRALDDFDFGVFVFSPDDVATVKDKSVSVVRDNVVFELGLFIGRIGRERTFYVIPRGQEGFHLPSDLAGITPLDYKPNPSDWNIQSELTPACSKIRSQIRKLGKVNRQPIIQEQAQQPTLDTSAKKSPFNLQEESEFRHISTKLDKNAFLFCAVHEEVDDQKNKVDVFGEAKFKYSLLKTLILNIDNNKHSLDQWFFDILEGKIQIITRAILPNNLKIQTFRIEIEESVLPKFLKLGLLERRTITNKLNTGLVYDFSPKLFRFVSWLEYNNLISDNLILEFVEIIRKDEVDPNARSTRFYF